MTTKQENEKKGIFLEEEGVVDLSNLFGKIKPKKMEVHSQNYLESFLNVAHFWDMEAISTNLRV